RRVPRAAHELIARAVRYGRLDDAVGEANLLLLDVHGHGLARRAADRLLQPLQILLRGDQARNPEHHAVAEEDLPERAADDGVDAPADGRWRRRLAGAPAARV